MTTASCGESVISHPRILLLDEPPLGLTPAIVETICEVIARLNREERLTVVQVEQNASMALGVVSSARVLRSNLVALHGATADLSHDKAARWLYLGSDTSDESASVAAAPESCTETPVSSVRSEREESAMSSLLNGVQSRTVETPRLRTNLLTAGDDGGQPVVLVHGNVSSARFFEETLLALPAGYWGLAPDLRGFGASETKPVDATRGLRDFADDLYALLGALGLLEGRRPHLVGWSMGGGIVTRYAADHPESLASLTLIDPLSPHGFGGTKDAAGTKCWPDGAGSGGGTANPDYVQRLRAGDRGEESPNSPRNVLNSFYFKPPFRAAPDREEVLMDEMLRMALGDQNYPGDSMQSPNWPGVGPGSSGVNNAMAPGLCDQSDFASILTRLPVLWVRGADDQVVSDASFFDFGTLGALGYVPGWPGADVFPSQPMVAQMRAVLDQYRAAGGHYEEVVIADSGHSPHI
jgi:pimeloyl-ACP methyl ester carboxylesterase